MLTDLRLKSNAKRAAKVSSNNTFKGFQGGRLVEGIKRFLRHVGGCSQSPFSVSSIWLELISLS